MDLETQCEILMMETCAYLEGVNSARKEILGLEEQENVWLGNAGTAGKGLEVKVANLRATNIKCHELQRALIEEEKQLKDMRTKQVESQLKTQLENCISWQKAANKAKFDCNKAKLRIEQEYKLILTKRLKDLTKGLVALKMATYNKPLEGDVVLLNSYLNDRLKNKQADLARLAKQRARFEKLKGGKVDGGRKVADDLSSVSSDMDTESEADSGVMSTQMSRALQENIALTLEKQKLKDELKLAKDRKNQMMDHIECSRADVKDLQEKLEDFRIAKEELGQLEEAIDAADAALAKYGADNAALRIVVDENNAQIAKVKEEISRLQAQVDDKKFSEKELKEAQELQERLNSNEEELKNVMQKIKEKAKENQFLKEENKTLAFEFEKVHLKNLETKKQLDEKRDKSDEELVELRRNVKQLTRDVRVKKENIKNLDESNKELDEKIDEANEQLHSLKEELDTSRKDKIRIDAQIQDIKFDLSKVLSKKAAAKEEMNKRLSDLEVKLQEKKDENEAVLAQIMKVRQENETAKNMLREVQEAKQETGNEQLKEKEVEVPSGGVYNYFLSYWFKPKSEDSAK